MGTGGSRDSIQPQPLKDVLLLASWNLIGLEQQWVKDFVKVALDKVVQSNFQGYLGQYGTKVSRKSSIEGLGTRLARTHLGTSKIEYQTAWGALNADRVEWSGGGGQFEANHYFSVVEYDLILRGLFSNTVRHNIKQYMNVGNRFRPDHKFRLTGKLRGGANCEQRKLSSCSLRSGASIYY